MINAYLKDSITVKRVIYGTWGGVNETPTTYNGRFVYETKMVRNLQGEQVVSTANVILPLMLLAHKDKISYDGKDYSILGIEEKKDFSKKYLLINLA